MLLAVDIGNTHIVIGLYQSDGSDIDSPIANWRLQSDSSQTVDEYALALVTLLSSVDYKPENISRIIISCVVPSLSRVFSKLSQKYFETEPLMVGPGIKTGLVISVDDPRTVGADRIVNSVACKELYGCPGIVVDFGTATTFDVLDEEGSYVGGVIAPGMLISAEALFERAAQLSSIELRKPQRLLGKNTQDSMLSGIVYGYVGMVDGILERLLSQAQGSRESQVVSTGGLARIVSDESRLMKKVVPDLTLRGLVLISRMNS